MPRGPKHKPGAIIELDGPEAVARTLVRSEVLSASSLRQEVQDALLAVLRSPGSPAMAVASAGRTLLEMTREGDDAASRETQPLSEMTAQQIDEELARDEAQGLG